MQIGRQRVHETDFDWFSADNLSHGVDTDFINGHPRPFALEMPFYSHRVPLVQFFRQHRLEAFALEAWPEVRKNGETEEEKEL